MTTATQIDFYSQALDSAWTSLEEAIVAMQTLNDVMWDEGGDTLTQRAPRADVALLLAKVKELNGEMASFQSTQEPIHRRVLLPGEQDLM